MTPEDADCSAEIERTVRAIKAIRGERLPAPSPRPRLVVIQGGKQ